jgi:hypothetical protein
MKYVWGYLIVEGLILIISFAAYAWNPNLDHYFITEDSLIENSTAIFFITAFFLGLWMLAKRKAHKLSFMLIAGLGLLGFLDELSFGERIFHFHASAIRGVKIDAVHDLFDVGYRIWQSSNHKVASIAILAGIIGLVFLLLLIKYRAKTKMMIKSIPRYPQYILMGFFAINIMLALIIDLNIIRSVELFILEEILEMTSAIALCFCALYLSTRE